MWYTKKKWRERNREKSWRKVREKEIKKERNKGEAAVRKSSRKREIEERNREIKREMKKEIVMKSERWRKKQDNKETKEEIKNKKEREKVERYGASASTRNYLMPRSARMECRSGLSFPGMSRRTWGQDELVIAVKGGPRARCISSPSLKVIEYGETETGNMETLESTEAGILHHSWYYICKGYVEQEQQQPSLWFCQHVHTYRRWQFAENFYKHMGHASTNWNRCSAHTYVTVRLT